MSKFAYIYTYIYTETTQPWHVYRAIILKNNLTCPATLFFVDQFGGLRVESEWHISKRNSAACWVYEDEFPLLAASVREDWELRHCWREALADVERIEKERAE